VVCGVNWTGHVPSQERLPGYRSWSWASPTKPTKFLPHCRLSADLPPRSSCERRVQAGEERPAPVRRSTPMAACSVGAVVAEPPQVPRYLVRSGTRPDTELGGRACAWSAAWRSTGPPARSGRTSPTMATTRAGGPASASCAHRGPDRPRPASPPTRRCGSSERPSAPTQPSIGSTQGACSSGERTSGRRTCRGRAWWSRPAGRRPLPEVVDIRLVGPLRPLGPLVAWLLQRRAAADLRRLKRILEAPAGGGPPQEATAT
jgi:hypothetical protein